MERNPQIFKALIDNIPSPVFFKGIDGRYLGCNLAFEQYLGLTREEIIGKTVFDLAPRELAERYKKMDDELFANPGTQEYESPVKYADGSLHDVIFHKATFADDQGQLAGQVGVIMDITVRKQNEARLAANESKYRSIFESLNDIYYRVSMDGIIQIISPSVFDRAGYRPEELIGRDVLEIYAEPDERAKMLTLINQQHRVIDYEVKLRKKDGSILQASLNSHIVFDGQRNPIAIEGMVHDIDQRKRTEEYLKVSEEKYRMLVEHQGEGIILCDFEEQITFANPAADAIIGVPTGTLAGRRFTEFISLEAAEQLYQQTGRRKQGEKSKYELEIIRPAGERRMLMVTAVPQLDTTGQPVGALAILQDITEQKKSEKLQAALY
jgi:PAS domain S-box-containing protein